MKTTNNFKKVGTWKTSFISFTAFIAMLLISFPVVAKDSCCHLSGKTEPAYSPSSTNNETGPTFQFEALASRYQYHAASFVEAEIALEIQNWTKDFVETESEICPSFYTESLKDIKYDAGKFVEADRALDLEKFNFDKNFLLAAERNTAINADMQISRFARQQVLMQENKPMR